MFVQAASAESLCGFYLIRINKCVAEDPAPPAPAACTRPPSATGRMTNSPVGAHVRRSDDDPRYHERSLAGPGRLDPHDDTLWQLLRGASLRAGGGSGATGAQPKPARRDVGTGTIVLLLHHLLLLSPGHGRTSLVVCKHVGRHIKNTKRQVALSVWVLSVPCE